MSVARTEPSVASYILNPLGPCGSYQDLAIGSSLNMAGIQNPLILGVLPAPNSAVLHPAARGDLNHHRHIANDLLPVQAVPQREK